MTPNTGLLHWASELPIKLPVRSDSTPGKVKLSRDTLPLPTTLSTNDVRALSTSRSPGAGAIRIEHIVLMAERPSFQALGLLFLAYALSDQTEAFRLLLSEYPNELSQIVIWPNEHAALEAQLGFRQRVSQVF